MAREGGFGAAAGLKPGSGKQKNVEIDVALLYRVMKSGCSGSMMKTYRGKDIEVTIEEINGNDKAVISLNLIGEISHSNIDFIEGIIDEYIGLGFFDFMIDLEKTRIVSSTGISFLMNISDSINAQNGNLVLTEMDSHVSKAFDMMGMHEIVRTIASKQDAISYLRNNC